MIDIEAERKLFDTWYAGQWPLCFKSIQENRASDEVKEDYDQLLEAWQAARRTGRAAAGLSDEIADLLETIDIKCSGALCCFDHGSTREFLKDIRALLAKVEKS
jgi:hypothetical protein